MSSDKKGNPSAHFDSPQQVLEDVSLSRADKFEILTSWANELRLLLVAEEENMGGEPGPAERLSAVEQALLSLGENEPSRDARG